MRFRLAQNDGGNKGVAQGTLKFLKYQVTCAQELRFQHHHACRFCSAGLFLGATRARCFVRYGPEATRWSRTYRAILSSTVMARPSSILSILAACIASTHNHTLLRTMKVFARLNSPIRHCEARSKLPCNSVRKSCQRLNRQMGAFALCIVQSIRLVQQHDGSMLDKVCDMTRSGAAACTFTSSQREQRNGNEFVVRRLISYPYSTLNKTIRDRLRLG